MSFSKKQKQNIEDLKELFVLFCEQCRRSSVRAMNCPCGRAVVSFLFFSAPLAGGCRPGPPEGSFRIKDVFVRVVRRTDGDWDSPRIPLFGYNVQLLQWDWRVRALWVFRPPEFVQLLNHRQLHRFQFGCFLLFLQFVMQFWCKLHIRYRRPLLPAYLNWFPCFLCFCFSHPHTNPLLFFLATHCNNLLFVAGGPPDLPIECWRPLPVQRTIDALVCTSRVLCSRKNPSCEPTGTDPKSCPQFLSHTSLLLSAYHRARHSDRRKSSGSTCRNESCRTSPRQTGSPLLSVFMSHIVPVATHVALCSFLLCFVFSLYFFLCARSAFLCVKDSYYAPVAVCSR